MVAAAAAGGHLQHRGTTGFDDDLANATATVRHEADAASSGSDTTAAVTFLVHHCGRVRNARYHAWTIAAEHGVLLQPLAAAVRPLRAAPPRNGARYNDVVTVVRVTITALMHVHALLHDAQRLLLAVRRVTAGIIIIVYCTLSASDTPILYFDCTMHFSLTHDDKRTILGRHTPRTPLLSSTSTASSH